MNFDLSSVIIYEHHQRITVCLFIYNSKATCYIIYSLPGMVHPSIPHILFEITAGVNMRAGEQVGPMISPPKYAGCWVNLKNPRSNCILIMMGIVVNSHFFGEKREPLLKRRTQKTRFKKKTLTEIRVFFFSKKKSSKAPFKRV